MSAQTAERRTPTSSVLKDLEDLTRTGALSGGAARALWAAAAWIKTFGSQAS